MRRMLVGASHFRDASLLQDLKMVQKYALQKHWEGDGSSPNTIQFQCGV